MSVVTFGLGLTGTSGPTSIFQQIEGIEVVEPIEVELQETIQVEIVEPVQVEVQQEIFVEVD